MDYFIYPPRLWISTVACIALIASTLLAGCYADDGGTGGPATGGSDSGTETETSTGPAASDVPGCECFEDHGVPWNACAAELPHCGTHFQDEAECDVSDGTGGWEPDPATVEANAMAVQCILDAAAAGEAFRFARHAKPGSQNNCTTEYAASPDGTLQVAETYQRDLCFDSVTSIRTAFDLAACQGMSDEEGWTCIQAAVDAATLEGTCQEYDYCGG